MIIPHLPKSEKELVGQYNLIVSSIYENNIKYTKLNNRKIVLEQRKIYNPLIEKKINETLAMMQILQLRKRYLERIAKKDYNLTLKHTQQFNKKDEQSAGSLGS